MFVDVLTNRLMGHAEPYRFDCRNAGAFRPFAYRSGRVVVRLLHQFDDLVPVHISADWTHSHVDHGERMNGCPIPGGDIDGVCSSSCCFAPVCRYENRPVHGVPTRNAPADP